MKPLSNQQRLHHVNTEQLFENYRSALGHAASYTYGMCWKMVRNTEYLFRDRDRRGNGKSLGPKTAQTTVAIDEAGWPVPMRVPDPRAFALNKAWLSGLPKREPLKKPRDLDQARAVAQLVQDQMPPLSFDSSLTSLHGDVRKMLPVLTR